MSFLSTTENVGFSGIPQTISDASCATQYKMGVEGVSTNNDVNIFIHDSSGDEQSYIPHLNDNFFHTKFKIDPNELYTFHDSDVIAGEITVSHTEDNYVFSDDLKTKSLESPIKDYDVEYITNGVIKEEMQTEVVNNGHYSPPANTKTPAKVKENKQNVKVSKGKSQVAKDQIRTNANDLHPSVHSPKALNSITPTPCTKASISSVNTNHVKNSQATNQANSETFLDVFKREQGVTESSKVAIKTEIKAEPINAPPPVKTPTTSGKKAASAKPTTSKPKRGRGPAVHEALQRISSQNRAIAVPNHSWHAPGVESFTYGPLEELPKRMLDTSSSDDDFVPDFDPGRGPVCVEEWAAESRGARLALRRAAMRRHVARAHSELKMASDVGRSRSLVAVLKKQLRVQGQSRLPTRTVNHLLAERGMTALLTSQERRQLRQTGWSGGESGATEYINCTEDHCANAALPCGRFCLSHITLATDQRLYASCAAVFAGGSRCKQPLLPLQDHTPLCTEHAWKRDNYDKLTQQSRPKKGVCRRRAPAPARARPPRRPRPPAPPPPSTHTAAHEVSVCSNSSAYDSSEDTNMGALSDSEYIVAPVNAHDLEVSEVEVGAVPADDILDPSVLSQIPDVAFTEFFNQGSTAFAESSELAAALEAVLDERGLDERVLDDTGDYGDGFVSHAVKNKIPVASSVSMEMSSSAPS